MLLAAAWMLVAASATAGMGSLASPAAESLQFLFSYIVGRAFFFRPPALNTFIRVLKILTIAMILIAAAENIAGRWLAHEAAASIFGTTPLGAVFRGNTIRATSTLDHPILFGVFCALVNAILLLWERSAGRRLLFSVICLAGCVLSQSSAALMAYVLGVAAYVYDRQMRQTPARWTIFWVLFGGAIGAVFLVTEHPIGWLVSHLTLDPETGYYRMLIWDAALERIGQSPLTGYSFQLFNENILDSTVDCVWLVEALRFGIPASAFLFLANMAAIWPAGRRKAPSADEFDQRMNLAFAIVLLLFVFSGITVHFWNYMWIFWGLCIGIKASLRERAVSR
ncbi:O-antigen ligase [Bradyrhizobium sp. WD16]|uniref:O-antigen ligase family protein n=1 Tax=Bradyrhizobium sp. WD16 TaxID=1521768 RepID=UPI0020A38BA9|nr:O-antigen ligase family protein [Bradyrhizobium sp. WD16]